MLILRMARSPVSKKHAESFRHLLASAPASLRPLIGPTLECQAAILGIPAGPLRPPDLGLSEYHFFRPPAPPREAEVLTDGVALYIVSLLESEPALRGHEAVTRDTPQGGAFILAVDYIGSQATSSNLEALESFLNQSFHADLKPYHYTSKRFEELKKEGRESPEAPSPDEVRRVSLLSDRATRSLALAIKASGGLLVRDLAKQLPPESRDRVDEIRRSLLEASLIDSEIVVVCTKTQAQTARAPCRDVLKALTEAGVKCACGRPIADERVEEAVAITGPAAPNSTKVVG